MIAVDMPPASVRNSTAVYVESLREGTTAHVTLGCPDLHHLSLTITAVQAMVHLHATWCPKCMGRRQR